MVASGEYSSNRDDERSCWRESTTGGLKVWHDAGAATELEMAGLDLGNSVLLNEG